MPNSLKIENLYAGTEQKEILNDISLIIKPGEIHALMGPNGSGKSTLAQVLMGHPEYKIKNQNSKVKINSQNILKLDTNERAKAGLFLAFQHPIAIPGVSVVNFLRIVYQLLYSEKPPLSALEFYKHLRSIVVKLDLSEELLKRSLNEGLSGGERKKMETLQMLVLNPQYIVLDELDTGTDVDALKLLGTVISYLMDQRKIKPYQLPNTKYRKPGILLITHYNRIFKYIKPDYVHIIKNGRIVKTGHYDLVDQIEKNGYQDF